MTIHAWLRFGLILLLAILLAGLGVTYIMKLQADANRETVREHLRQVSQFALMTPPDANQSRHARDSIPPATILADFPIEQRLSWVVAALPTFNQQRQDTAAILQQIDQRLPWTAEVHATVARTPIRVLLCPANPAWPAAGQPAVTQLVGITGLGDNAGQEPFDSPKAGSFRYDAFTPLASFSDGTSQTLLFAETNRQLGPWLQGGPATARGVPEDSPTAFGDRLGGVHPGGAFVSYADGHAEFVRETIAPHIFRMLATRSGGAAALTEFAD